MKATTGEIVQGPSKKENDKGVAAGGRQRIVKPRTPKEKGRTFTRGEEMGATQETKIIETIK